MSTSRDSDVGEPPPPKISKSELGECTLFYNAFCICHFFRSFVLEPKNLTWLCGVNRIISHKVTVGHHKACRLMVNSDPK